MPPRLFENKPPQKNAQEEPGSSQMNRRQLLKVLGAGITAGLGVAAEDASWFRHSRKELEEELARDQVIHTPRRHLPVRSSETPVISDHERIHINQNEPTFNRLRTLGAFPREHRWAITASSEAFHELGSMFAENPKTQHLLDQNEVNILVPAAGVLLSPLEMAFQFAERSERLQTISLTLTDIDQQTYGSFDHYLAMMIRACDNVSDLHVQTETHAEIAHEPGSEPAKKIMSFTYHSASGRSVSIRINYEFCMSGEHYFRAQSAAEADIYILHDIDRRRRDGHFPIWNEAGDLYTLLSDTSTPHLREKSHYCVNNAHVRHYGESNVGGLGSVVTRISGMRFGCGENHRDRRTIDETRYYGEPTENFTNIFELDSELAGQLQAEGGERVLQSYVRILVSDEFMDAHSDDRREGLKILADFVHKTRNRRVKSVIKRAARELFARIGSLIIPHEPESVRQNFLRNIRSLLDPIING